MSLSEQKDWIRVCYYGDPGTAKTTAVAGAAHLGKLRFVAAEPGIHRRPLDKLKVPTDNIVVERNSSYASIRGRLDEMHQDLFDDKESWAAFAIDTVTEMNREWLGSIVDAKAQNSGHDDALDDKRFFISRDYYSQTTQMWQRILRASVDLEAHVAFTAHVRRDVDEDDGTVKYGPDLPPAMQGNLMGAVNMLIRTRDLGNYSDGRPIMVGQTSNAGKYKVKDRLNCLPAIMAYPSLDRLAGYVDGTLDETTDPLQKELNNWIKSQKKEK